MEPTVFWVACLVGWEPEGACREGHRVGFWQALWAAGCSTHLKHLLAFPQVSMLQKKLRSGRSSSLRCGAGASRSQRVAVVVGGAAAPTPAVGTGAAPSAPQSHRAQWPAVPGRCAQSPPRWRGRHRLWGRRRRKRTLRMSMSLRSFTTGPPCPKGLVLPLSCHHHHPHRPHLQQRTEMRYC